MASLPSARALAALAALGAALLLGSMHLEDASHSARVDADGVVLALAALRARAESFSRAEGAPCSRNRVVALGFVGNLDVVVGARETLQRLLAAGRIAPEQLAPRRAHASIASAEALAETLATFVAAGAAAEKAVSDAALFDELVAAAQAEPGAVTSLGGNAAIMATRFALRGCRTVVGSWVGPTLRSKLTEAGVSIMGDDLLDRVDDVHLILEYPKGALLPSASGSAARLEAPRANRFILVRDKPLSLPVDAVRAHVAALSGELGVLVLSGFHLFDGHPGAERQRQLAAAAELLRSVPSRVVTHVEVASMAEEALYGDLLASVLAAAQSAGANEQETAALADYVVNGTVSKTGYPSQPSVQRGVAQVAAVITATGLQRFHLHSLAFHAVCAAADTRFAADAERSLVESVLTAPTQACGAQGLAPEQLELLLPPAYTIGESHVRFDPRDPVQCRDVAAASASSGKPAYARALRCCVAPVLVCKRPLRTVGLGDHISASGLTVMA
jgi:ADP-dependent glucokinase